ncbi:DUF3800 domain-containing protein [Herbiconiux liangxiaofengii]|uniref:DUF3800 domain-containing protein n=1 Tax=Herbiconiux liangxiaofengii TaxID=3342795 RepID=UPI0035B76E4B
MRFGDYVVYVDESGDHELRKVNPEFPVFVLAFCIFPVQDYVDQIVPAVQRLKFRHFGHDMVVLHEREIRKSLPPFDILLRADVRARFMDELSGIIDRARFGVVSCVINKHEFIARRGLQENPYHVALEYGLERVFFQLQARKQVGRTTHVVFESRGKQEDRLLELEFRRVLDTTRIRGLAQTLAFKCAPKSANSTGLQLADMIARPIGLSVVRGEQSNRSWSIIASKIVRSPSGKTAGFGLKVYP